MKEINRIYVMVFFHMQATVVLFDEINVHINSYIQRGGPIKFYTLGLFVLAETIWERLLVLNELA